MSRPKILVFTTAYAPLIGGVEIAIQEIAKRLSGRFVFFILTAKLKKGLAVEEQRKEGHILRLGFGTDFDKFLFPIWGFLKARKHARRGGILWGMDISTTSLGAAMLKFFYPQSFLVLTVQYGYGENRLRKGRRGMIKRAFKFMLGQADQVTVISNHLREVVRNYGYQGPVELIPNGVDINKFQILNSKIQNPNEKIIITTSRLVPKNGVDILIKAVAEVSKDFPEIRCHIIGDGPERSSCQSLVKNYGLENNIKFLGEVPYEEIPRYLHHAHLFVRPSRSEGMGNSFVEAMAAGLPVIGTPVGGIVDIIKDGQTGLLATPENPEDLAKKIKILLTDEELIRKLVRNGQTLVEKNFSWDGISSAFQIIFENFNKGKRKLRLLVTTGIFPPDIGGPATYSKILLDELPKNGLDTSILSFGEVRKYPKLVRHFIYFLKCLHRGWRVDIIFAQDPVSVGLPSVLAAKLLRKKFMLKVVGDYAWEQGVQRFGVKDLIDVFLSNKYGWRVELLRKIQKYVAKCAKIIITPSNYLKKIIEKWGLEEKKIEVIYNSFEPYSTSLSKEEARKELKLEGKILVSVGRLVPWKGLDLLIDLVEDMGKEEKDLRLFIIGSGPEEKHVRFKIKKLGLEDKIILTGKISRPQVEKYLKAGDVFVLNTGYEGLPHAILEAMAAGLPVVTTNVGGNPEVVEDKTSGLLVKYNDYLGFRNSINALLKDDGLRQLLGRNAMDKVKFFSKDKMLLDTVRIIKNL